MTTPISLALLLLATNTLAWENLPQVPAAHRSQYLVLGENGGYKYGYNTGDGNSAKQEADPKNQVEGHYFYLTPDGRNIDIKYTAGVQGFVPEGLEQLQAALAGSSHGLHQASFYHSAPSSHGYHPSSSLGPTSATQGYHYSQPQTSVFGSRAHFAPTLKHEASKADASYSFQYNAGDHSREETSDAYGKVQGKYSYENGAGHHDLSYVAGAGVGFQVTGGSLAEPNGLNSAPSNLKTYKPATHIQAPKSVSFSLGHGSSPSNNGATSGTTYSSGPSQDGSYSFSYSTGDSSREESVDSSGNLQGKYSFKNEAGHHDLTYVAGSSTGFQVTGGSLAQANAPLQPSTSIYKTAQNNEGSYHYKSQTNSDDGSYRPEAGNDGSYHPEGDDGAYHPDSEGAYHPDNEGAYRRDDKEGAYQSDGDEGAYHHDESPSGDASYSFSIDTNDYKRTETSDSQGNVQGTFTYKNGAGNHDLSFVAGATTGFLPTSGSLKLAPGLTESQLRSNLANSGNYDSLKKSWDVTNLRQYLPPVGKVVAPAPVLPKLFTPFSVNAVPVVPKIVPAVVPVHLKTTLPETKLSYSLDGASVKAYLPPTNDKGKFGYIYESKH